MATTTTITKPEIADQLQPYVSVALSESEKLFQDKADEGYQGFGRPQVVGMGDDLSQAIQAQIGGFVPNQAALGVEGGLAGLTNQLQKEAAQMTKAGAAGFDQDVMDSYMNPYQQGVTDVAIRKAREESQRQQMMGDSAAAKAGAFGGNRRFLLEGMRGADLLETVGDLQAKGSAQAFDKAIAAMENQRRRELTGGSQLSGIGQTRVEGIGKALEASEQAAGRKRDIEQEILSDQVREFQEKRDFRGTNIDDYIRRVGGATPKSAGWGERKTAKPRYSGFEKFTGYASGIGSLLGNLLFAEGGPVREGFDEEIGQEGGLTAIAGPAVRFNTGNPVVMKPVGIRRTFPVPRKSFYGTVPPKIRSGEELRKDKFAKEGTFKNYILESERKTLEVLHRQKKDMIERMRRNKDNPEKIARFTKRIDKEINDKRASIRRRLAEGQTNPIIDQQKRDAKVADKKEKADQEQKKLIADAKAKLEQEREEAIKKQAAKYQKYKEEVERQNKRAKWFSTMEAIRQLPLSVKKDPASIQKLAKQKQLMDEEDYEKYGSPQARKAALEIAKIGQTRTAAGKAGRDRLKTVRGLILKHYRALAAKELGEITPARREQLLAQARREVASVYNPTPSIYSGEKKK